tara:strand:+ start:1368 stop:1610 length:243 start_codon:yes stop_codon:yes gene_type:complete
MSKIILTEKQYQKLLKKVNEEVDLTNYKAPFSSEDFINWVNSEYDLEFLNMVRAEVDARIDFLNKMIGMATRKEIKGFRR